MVVVGEAQLPLEVIIRNELYSACKVISGVLGINGDLLLLGYVFLLFH